MKGCRPLTTEERTEVAGSFAGRYASRDRALFVLGCMTGLRVSELLSIKVKDVLNGNGQLADSVYIERRAVKGRTSGRRIMLNAEAKQALTEWLAELEQRGLAGPNCFVFQSQKSCRRPMSVVQAWRITAQSVPSPPPTISDPINRARLHVAWLHLRLADSVAVPQKPRIAIYEAFPVYIPAPSGFAGGNVSPTRVMKTHRQRLPAIPEQNFHCQQKHLFRQ